MMGNKKVKVFNCPACHKTLAIASKDDKEAIQAAAKKSKKKDDTE